MILRMLAVVSIAACVAGCAGSDRPEPTADGWSAQRLSGADSGVVPGYVPVRVLDRDTLASMDASERALLVRGAQIRETAASVPDPEEAAEDYAVRQRALGTPPE